VTFHLQKSIWDFKPWIKSYEEISKKDWKENILWHLLASSLNVIYFTCVWNTWKCIMVKTCVFKWIKCCFNCSFVLSLETLKLYSDIVEDMPFLVILLYIMSQWIYWCWSWHSRKDICTNEVMCNMIIA